MSFAGFCLMTRDVPRLSAFYRDLLHITSEGDDVHQEMHLPGCGFAIYNDGHVAETPKGDFYIMFDVGDVGAEHARLLDMGVTILEPPTTRPWGLRSMHFLDPDGNRVTFRTPAK